MLVLGLLLRSPSILVYEIVVYANCTDLLGTQAVDIRHDMAMVREVKRYEYYMVNSVQVADLFIPRNG